MGLVVTEKELSEGKVSKVVNEIIVRHTEPILVLYAEWWKRDSKGLIKAFLNKDSVRMIACLIIFACKKNGLLKELEGKKDFSEWVNRQNLEERWRGVLANFLLIIWGVTK